MSRKEAAEYLGIKTQTLAVWALDGRYGLNFAKVGRRAIYRQSELDRFIKERTCTHTGQVEGFRKCKKKITRRKLTQKV